MTRSPSIAPARSPAARQVPVLVLALICDIALAGAAQAQGPSADCREVVDNEARLACYDLANGRLPPMVPGQAQVLPAPGHVPATEVATGRSADKLREARIGATLGQRWELDAADSLGTFLPRPYKPMYVLPLTVASSVNKSPSSDAPGHTQPRVEEAQSVEAKFQISLKAKIWEGLFTPDLNLWAGYTQSSRWQVYNSALSRPFHETNYEPELIAALRTDYTVLGWNGRLAALSLTHQSNGRELPLSRSWNRVIGEIALEREQWSMVLRPWWRVSESTETDDNPGIENYVGRGEFLLTHRWGAQVATLQARHSLRSGENSRGSLQLDWAFPIGGTLKGYVQGFTGYGESLIDFNFKQSKIGIGVSLVEWL